MISTRVPVLDVLFRDFGFDPFKSIITQMPNVLLRIFISIVNGRFSWNAQEVTSRYQNMEYHVVFRALLDTLGI
jgi:hypothetical protein